jgi:hypothetical protein
MDAAMLDVLRVRRKKAEANSHFIGEPSKILPA